MEDGILFWMSRGALVAVGGIAMKVIDYMMSKKTQPREVGPQPFIVALEKDFVPRHEFERHVKENNDQHTNMFARLDALSPQVRGIEVKLDMVYELALRIEGNTSHKEGK